MLWEWPSHVRGTGREWHGGLSDRPEAQPQGLSLNISHWRCHTHRWAALLQLGLATSCFTFEGCSPRSPVQIERQQQSLVGSPRVQPRAEPSPGREAQRTGEAENPWLNKQLETVRFNQQRSLDFPPFSSVAASILDSMGQMRFSGL